MGERLVLREDDVPGLARLAGVDIPEDELAEVTARFGSLMLELGRLEALDLSGVEPVSVFPDEG